jgi:uncharacterized SAM-binding protein YcdF (DUF218 family)
MIKNKNIICISSIDWDFNWQGHQEIMSSFAKNNNRVLFIENTGVRSPALRDIPRLKRRLANWLRSTKGFRKVTDNLYVYSPVILPFPYSRIARWINKRHLLVPIKRWMQIMEFHNPIIWTYLPTGIALDLANAIDHSLLVYYCVADFSELISNPKKIRKTENELIKRSDIIFAQGNVLAEKCKRFNDNVYVFPPGVKIESFDNSLQNEQFIVEDLRNIKKPIIGYIGGVHKHVDFGIMQFIAKAHSDWSIVFIGPVQTDVSEIADFENVFLLGQKEFSILARYIAAFDVCIIPYKINAYTSTVFPSKLNEYLAMGKPVVSTELSEIVDFNKQSGQTVLIGKTYKEFDACIAKALLTDNQKLARQRIESARRNSWVVRIEQMSILIEKTLEKKAYGPENWKEILVKFYKISRRKILKFACLTLGIYLLLFYTPLIWLMAVPLKIAGEPKQADCIVVFAGGVGESGKAGQGYEERVQYAVELYKNNYAKQIIFSSGYMYAFKEPLVMKVLAVSLGVPEDAIILEDKAKNTYENLKFTKEILSDKGWDEVLLVSSPYHMRRVSLVANKIATDIKIIYTPIPESRFYSHGIGSDGKKVLKQINLRQIRALLHEYLGIAYYWYKGYV